jgi:hypothetical protein
MLIFFSLLLLLNSCDYPEKYVPGNEIEKDLIGLEIYLPDTSIYVMHSMQAEVLYLLQDGGRSLANHMDIDWETDGSGIISIDDSGLITALKPGFAAIIARQDGLHAEGTVIAERETDYSRILLSEVMYDPAAGGGGEFIELYNGNEYDCDLYRLALVDGAEMSTPFMFPANSIIAAFGRIVVARNADDFVAGFGSAPDLAGFSFQLNNDGGETVLLVGRDGSIIDTVFIEGGYDKYPADDKWGSALLPSAARGNSIQRLNFLDTDTYNDWVEGIPDPGK